METVSGTVKGTRRCPALYADATACVMIAFGGGNWELLAVAYGPHITQSSQTSAQGQGLIRFFSHHTFLHQLLFSVATFLLL